MPLHVHPRVLKVATEMANQLFEDYARDNDYYRQFKANGGTEKRARKMFVARVAPRLYEEARKALTLILAGDYPESVKEEVFEALCKDNLLRANRTVAKEVAVVPPHLH